MSFTDFGGFVALVNFAKKRFRLLETKPFRPYIRLLKYKSSANEPQLDSCSFGLKLNK